MRLRTLKHRKPASAHVGPTELTAIDAGSARPQCTHITETGAGRTGVLTVESPAGETSPCEVGMTRSSELKNSSAALPLETSDLGTDGSLGRTGGVIVASGESAVGEWLCGAPSEAVSLPDMPASSAASYSRARRLGVQTFIFISLLLVLAFALRTAL